MAYSAMLGAGIAAVPPGRGRWLALAGTWTLAELARWSWPFGGVPLANLAIGQVAGPLAPVLRVGGPVLLVAVTVLAGSALAATASAVLDRDRSPAGPGAAARPLLAAGGLAALVLLAVAGATVAPRGRNTGSVDVALVQGGGEQGTRKEDTGVVAPFERHVTATAGVTPPVEVVVWPEDVVDTEEGFADHPWSREVGDLARALDAPMIVGVVEGAGAERFRNAAVLLDADGEIVQRYEKVHRVPFGEYVPLRWLLEPIAGAALPGRDALVGERPGYLDVPGPVGRVAVPISWEVFFPDRIREGVEAGAGLVLNPTNGSSFTGTIVQTQQVASSRMRAIETGRWVAQVAPTGFSAVIDDEGRVLARSAIGERRVIQREVRLREGQTLFTRWGNGPGVALAGGCVAAGWALDQRGRRRG